MKRSGMLNKIACSGSALLIAAASGCFATDAGAVPQKQATPKGGGNYMTLTPTDHRNSIGNPIYNLTLYINGGKISSFYAVTGRAHTQNRNRHVAGTQAPLPDGKYRVARSAVPGSHPEIGGIFLPIYPTFRTGRSYLGIHWDPSYEKTNGEDGTSGCIALRNSYDLQRVLQYIQGHAPQYLLVDIQ
ncbi:MAG: L,D-transpeptidase [Xenococcaceae cyanobacterium]